MRKARSEAGKRGAAIRAANMAAAEEAAARVTIKKVALLVVAVAVLGGVCMKRGASALYAAVTNAGGNQAVDRVAAHNAEVDRMAIVAAVVYICWAALLLFVVNELRGATSN